MAVARIGAGAGASSTGAAVTFNGPNITTSDAHTVAIVGVVISVSSNSTSTTCTATYGGTSMTLLSGALTLLGSSTSRAALGIFYLYNPPTGTSSVVVTPGGSSTKAGCAANAVAYSGVDPAIGAQQAAASVTLSATSVASGYDFAVTSNGAALSSPTQTQQYYVFQSGISGVGKACLIQDAAGTGSALNFSSAGTATTPETLAVALTPYVAGGGDVWTTTHATGTAGSGNITLTIPATTAGNLLVAFGIGHTSIAFSDSASQTWTELTSENNISGSSKFYRWGYVPSTVGGVTTVTLTTGSGNSWLQVVEYNPGSGNTVNYVASSETNWSVSAVSPVGGTVNGPPAAGDLVLIGAACNAEAYSTFSAGTGITDIAGQAGTASGSAATLVVGENTNCSASPAANLTYTPTSSQAVGATALAFHAAASGAAPSNCFFTMF